MVSTCNYSDNIPYLQSNCEIIGHKQKLRDFN